MTAEPQEEMRIAEVLDSPSLKELGARLAVLNAAKKQIEAEAKKARADLEEALREARRKHGTRSVDVHIPDDLAPEGMAAIANIGFNKDGDPTIGVAPGQMEAAVEWVAERHPEQIEEVIRPAYLKSLLEQQLVRQSDGTITTEDGELVEWARAEVGAKGAMVLRYTGAETGQQRLLEAIGWVGPPVLPALASAPDTGD